MTSRRVTARAVSSHNVFPSSSNFSALSLHDALPISARHDAVQHFALARRQRGDARVDRLALGLSLARGARSEEHTSELQSLRHLVCRLLLEKQKAVERGWGAQTCSRPVR